jgi:hypothetical protein
MLRNRIEKWRGQTRQALRTDRTLTFRPALEALEGRWLPSISLITTASFRTGTGNAVFTAVPEDSAVLSGSNSLNGTINFTLFAPDNTMAYKETVPTSGDRTYNTSNVNVATQVGTYKWTASFVNAGIELARDQGRPAEQVMTVKANTTTMLVSSVNPSTVSQSVTFTATVGSSGGTPSGTVQFVIDGTNFGSPVTLSSGKATSAATSSLSVRNQTIQAIYSGDTLFNGNTGTLTQTVVNATTSTAVTSSANPSVSGQSVTFTATVAASSGSGTPTGTVSFVDGSTPLGQVSLSSGGEATASFTTSALTVGSHIITASYGGDSTFADSTSAALTQTVGKATSITTLVSSLNPSVVGRGVTFTVTVTPVSGSGTPTGTVSFVDGSTPLGQVPLSGSGGEATASFTTTFVTVGSHNITATYGGDSNFLASTSNPIMQSVFAFPFNSDTETTLVLSSVSSQTYKFIWTVTAKVGGQGIQATGNVILQDGGTAVPGQSQSVSPGTGQFSVTFPPGTKHSMTARYTGDSIFNKSTSNPSLDFTVTNPPVATVTSVSSSVPNGSVYGQSVTFTATVKALSGSSPPAGFVQFTIDNTTVQQNFSSTTGLIATAAYTVNDPNILTTTTGSSPHRVVATYMPNGSNFLSTSDTLTQAVRAANTRTVLTSSGRPSNVGQTVTFTATVTNAETSSSIAPTGTVQFTVDGIPLGGAITLNNNGNNSVANSPSINTLSVGNYNVQVTYSPTGNFSLSPSPGTLTQPVNQAGTNTTVTSSVNPSVFGQSVSFTAIIGVQPPGAGTPSGTVQFLIDDKNFGSPVSVTSAIARSAPTFFFVGTHKITASYSGDANFTGSNGILAGGQVVNPASTTTTVTTSGSPSQLGHTVTFTATISVQSPGTTQVTNPTGSVTFFDGSKNIGQGTVGTTGGVTSASFSTTSLTVGTHTISASYNGDGSFKGSNGTLSGGQIVTNPNTIADGTILVLSYPLSSLPPEQQKLLPNGIVGIDPNTHVQSPVVTGGSFKAPVTIREGPDHSGMPNHPELYVVDSSAMGTGAVIVVDPNTGQVSTMYTSKINEPVALAIDNANNLLYVVNLNPDNMGMSHPNLVTINLKTGASSTPVSLMDNVGNPVATPVALALDPKAGLYLADEGPAVPVGTAVGTIFTVNVQTGVLTPFSQNGMLDHMIDLGLDGNGQLLAFIAGNFGNVIQVDSQGNQTRLTPVGLFSTDPNLSGVVLDGGTVDTKHNGTIYVSAYDLNGNVHSRLQAIDPNTGTASSPFADDGSNLSVVTGLTVFSTTGGGAAAPSAPRDRRLHAGVAALVRPGQSDRIDLSAAGTSLASQSVTVPPQHSGMLLTLEAAPSAVTMSRAATDSVFTDWDGSLIQDAFSADPTISEMASGHR